MVGGELIILGFKNLPQSSFKPIIAETLTGFLLTVLIFFQTNCTVCIFKGRHRGTFTVNVTERTMEKTK